MSVIFNLLWLICTLSSHVRNSECRSLFQRLPDSRDRFHIIWDLSPYAMKLFVIKVAIYRRNGCSNERQRINDIALMLLYRRTTAAIQDRSSQDQPVPRFENTVVMNQPRRRVLIRLPTQWLIKRRLFRMFKHPGCWLAIFFTQSLIAIIGCKLNTASRCMSQFSFNGMFDDRLIGFTRLSLWPLYIKVIHDSQHCNQQHRTWSILKPLSANCS